MQSTILIFRMPCRCTIRGQSGRFIGRCDSQTKGRTNSYIFERLAEKLIEVKGSRMQESSDQVLVSVEEHAAAVGPYGGAEFFWLLVLTLVLPALMLVIAYVVM